jgi:hypothetical protein
VERAPSGAFHRALAATVANLALVDDMLALARKHAHQPDARVRHLARLVDCRRRPGKRVGNEQFEAARTTRAANRITPSSSLRKLHRSAS